MSKRHLRTQNYAAVAKEICIRALPAEQERLPLQHTEEFTLHRYAAFTKVLPESRYSGYDQSQWQA